MRITHLVMILQIAALTVGVRDAVAGNWRVEVRDVVTSEVRTFEPPDQQSFSVPLPGGLLWKCALLPVEKVSVAGKDAPRRTLMCSWKDARAWSVAVDLLPARLGLGATDKNVHPAEVTVTIAN